MTSVAVHRILKAIVSLLLGLLVCTGVFFSATAQKAGQTDAKEFVESEIAIGFDEYISMHGSAEYPQIEDICSVWDNVSSDGIEKVSEYGGVANVFRVFNRGTEITFKAKLSKAGFYAIRLSCCHIAKDERKPQYTLKINGKAMNRQAENLSFPLAFKDIGEITQNENGEDIRPEKEEVREWISFYACNPSYNSDGWMPVYLNEGENSITLKVNSSDIYLTAPVICSPQKTVTYEEYLERNSERADNTKDTYYKVFQGEKAYRTSSTELYATYDRVGASTVPNDPIALKLNTIGQNTWNQAGQWIEWEIDVSEDGFYNIGTRARQNISRGMTSYRRLYIDGQLCFDKAERLAFPYDMKWKTTVFGEDEGYLFYLTKGKHVIRLEASLGNLTERVVRLEAISEQLNALYRRIIMITGTSNSVDSWRDYMLDEQIPQLEETLASIKEQLADEENLLSNLGIDASSNMAQLLYQIDMFLEDSEKIPTKIDSFRSNISSLSAWAQSLKEQPLEIDYIFVKSPSAEIPESNGGFFKSLSFRFKMFLASYTTDYAKLSSADTEKETLTVWTASGRDQAQALLDLINSRFTPENNISVSLSIMQSGLNESIAAGRNPDVMLNYASDVVALAARNVLADISQYNEFNNIKQRFTKDAFKTYTYKGGIYAVPLQQYPLVMFYRKDIFNELQITPPNTWEEFMEVLTIIQNNKLTAGLSAGTTTVANISLFELFVYQNNGRILSEDLESTALEEEICYNAFKQWTELFTRRSLSPEVQFFERFRSGEIPLAIQPISMYSQIKLGAPEIDGLWEMTQVPQTAQSDGTKSNLTVGTFTPAFAFEGDNKELSFRFLNWLTSPEIQREYGQSIESLLGVGARYFSANLEAVDQLNWTAEEAEICKTQMKIMTVTPAIPANYYLARNITNAFRKVYNEGYHPREAILMYKSVIDSEIERKNYEIKRQNERSGAE